MTLCLILLLSWKLTQFQPIIPEWTHIGIQKEIRKIIQNHIKADLPSSQNIQFNKIWTERIGKSSIKVSFSYSFEDAKNHESSRIEIEGSTLLRKDETHLKEKEEIWNFDHFNISEKSIQFNDGLVIHSSK